MKIKMLMLTVIATIMTQNTPVYAEEFNPQPFNTKKEILAEMEETYAPIFDELSKDDEISEEGRKLLSDETFRTEFLEICYEYDEFPENVLAVIYTESRFDPEADNGICIGMMQINEKWHEERMEKLGVTDLTDPISNIKVGVDYLAELQDGRSLKYALMIYNMGFTKAREALNEYGYSKYANSISEYAENIRTKMQESGTNK